MKAALKNIFYNRSLPVLSGSLRGTWLRVNNLIKGSVFIRSYEPDKQKAFDLLIQERSIFFDIGANIGLHCYYMAKKHPSVKVYAFEPLPANVSYMKEVISKNQFESIQIIETAVGKISGEIYFDERDDNSKGGVSNFQTKLKVNLKCLDDFVSETNIYPDLLKIDVEGAEGDVLNGAEKLVSKKQPVFVIELHNPEQDIEVARFLISHDYYILRINSEPQNSKAKAFLPIKNLHASWPDPDGVWGNIVAIHQAKYDQFNIE